MKDADRTRVVTDGYQILSVRPCGLVVAACVARHCVRGHDRRQPAGDCVECEKLRQAAAVGQCRLTLVGTQGKTF